MGKCVFTALCDATICTGCMACVNSCRHGAITMELDTEGFYRPSIDEAKCIDCGACDNICPQKKHLECGESAQKAFRCWHKKKSVRRNSSSGGLFSAVGDKIISDGGIVYGVKLDSSLKAVFSSSDVDGNTTDSYKGSKYVQALIGDNIFRGIRSHLVKGRTVLFSGTPCQVAGLKSFLGRDYENLYTIDFLCHGVPSPLIFKMYKEYLENEAGSKIKSFAFRDKWKSWRVFNFKISFENGVIKRQFRTFNTFYQIFLRDFSLNTACYKCHYTTHKRNSDITMADYWYNIGKKSLFGDGDKGISLCVVNTEKGERLLSLCTRNIEWCEIDAVKTLDAYKYFNHPTEKPKGRDAFWEDVAKGDYALLASKYGYPAESSLADNLLMRTGYPKCSSLIWKIINKIESIIKHKK